MTTDVTFRFIRVADKADQNHNNVDYVPPHEWITFIGSGVLCTIYAQTILGVHVMSGKPCYIDAVHKRF